LRCLGETGTNKGDTSCALCRTLQTLWLPTAWAGRLLRRREFCNHWLNPAIKGRVKNFCVEIGRYKATPTAVPSVLVMTSFKPESRVGRKYCAVSIARLMVSPRTSTATRGRGIGRTSEK